MPSPEKMKLQNTLHSNHGAVLLMLLFFLVAIFSTLLVSKSATLNKGREQQKRTNDALMQAKEALIAWSVLQGDRNDDNVKNTENKDHRPGTLPCPDLDNDGDAEGSCASNNRGTLGRLPWKTLGINPLRDAEGELLWYAVSDDFRHHQLHTSPINSDSEGTLDLYASNATDLLTPKGEKLAAVLFSPGIFLPEQNRSSAQNDVKNYLESFADKNNTSAKGPFISGPVKNKEGEIVLNDIVIGISAHELISAVEKRALEFAKTSLEKYAGSNAGKYPAPGKIDCLLKNKKFDDACPVDNSRCMGRFPEEAVKNPQNWFHKNNWENVIIYAVNGKNVKDNTGTNTDCTAPLMLDEKEVSYILIAPGTAQAHQERPSANLGNYLEDAKNAKAWKTFIPEFFTPGASSNDQLRASP